jgi:hypothetical protein
MKAFRILGLLGILTVTLGGVSKPARATVVTCSYTCSGVRYFETCFQSLRSCCDDLPTNCPDGYTYQGGDCTDGQSFC